MAWSSGVFTRFFGSTGWQDDKAALIKILASRHDTHDQDLAQGLNVLLQNLQANSHFKVSSLGGSANAITGNLTPAISVYTPGMFVVLTPTANNSGATTLALNGLGALDLLNIDGTACVGGELLSGIPVLLMLDAGGDDWIIANPNAVKSRGREVAPREWPKNSQNGSYSIVGTDYHKIIIYNGTGGHTLTVQLSQFKPDDVIRVWNQASNGVSPVALAATGAGLFWMTGSALVGPANRTLAYGGYAELTCNQGVNVVLAGQGIT